MLATQANRALEKSSKRAGISLIETVVALTILAVFVTGAAKIIIASQKLSDKAREHYAAINIAKSRIELVRTFEFGQVDNFLEDKVLVNASGAPDVNGNFRRTTTVSEVSSNLLEMAVTVEIRNRKKLAFTGEREQLRTFFAEYLTEESSVGGGVSPNSI